MGCQRSLPLYTFVSHPHPQKIPGMSIVGDNDGQLSGRLKQKERVHNIPFFTPKQAFWRERE